MKRFIPWTPSYPRKPVSRLIGRGPNLDTRLRGNDGIRAVGISREIIAHLFSKEVTKDTKVAEN